MGFVSLFLDRAFPDFNFSQTWDPNLRPDGGPSQLALIKMIYAARRGDRSARVGFTDAMYWTLRQESFECFQRARGPKTINYRDWFYAKLSQFLEILVWETLALDGLGPDGQPRVPKTDRPWEESLNVLGPGGPGVDPPDLEKTFAPADNDPVFWAGIVQEICSAPGNRLTVLEGIMGRLRRQRGCVTPEGSSARVRPRREWGRTRERNRIIRQALAEGKSGLELCSALDAGDATILPIMRERDVSSFVTAWDDKELRRNIQQLIAKYRLKP
jgi:hypothetical protein